MFIHFNTNTSDTTSSWPNPEVKLLQNKEYTKTPKERERWDESVILVSLGPWSSHFRQTERPQDE